MPIYPYSFQLPPLNVQDIPNDGAVGEFLGISAGGVLDWLPVASGGGDLLAANNLSELTATAGTARTNLGLGTGDSPTFKNLTISTGTLATSAPVTISQTWDAGSNVMTALKVVATDTASGSTSNLLELWAGSTPALDFAVTKAGVVQAYGTYSSSGANYARLALACDSSGNATISTQALGTGVAGTVSINGVPVGLGKDNVTTNIAIGTNALNLHDIVNSSRNIGIGNNALRATSVSCVAIGIDALQNGATMSGNVAVGDSALFATTSPGNRNTGIGYWAMRGNNSSDSVGVGWAVLLSTTATNTCALGAQAGRYITGGATNNSVAFNSIYIGNDTKAAASGETNQIVIGYDATGLGSNTAVLGNDTINKTALKGNVGIGTTAPSSKLEVVGAVTVSTYIKVSPVAVTSLPDAATAGVGARAFVNDALAPVFGSAVANGGSAKVPVYSDGSAWYVG